MGSDARIDPSRDKHRRGDCDLNRRTSVRRRLSRLRAAVEDTGLAGRERRSGRLAWVVPHGADFGMARMFERIVRRSGLSRSGNLPLGPIPPGISAWSDRRRRCCSPSTMRDRRPSKAVVTSRSAGGGSTATPQPARVSSAASRYAPKRASNSARRNERLRSRTTSAASAAAPAWSSARRTPSSSKTKRASASSPRGSGASS